MVLVRHISFSGRTFHLKADRFLFCFLFNTGFQYKFSDNRHGFVLMQAEAIEGYNYLSWQEIFRAEDEYKKELELVRESLLKQSQRCNQYSFLLTLFLAS